MASAKSTDESWKTAKSMYDFGATDIDGNEVSFEKYKGHVCLVVNVACKCGLTDTNYKQLQALYNEFAESKGLRILVFPSNQFLNQEPGTNEEIKEFVKNNYNGQFDMFSKIEVNGNNAHPFWKYLKMKQTGTLGSAIKWNFTKFLVDKEGQVVKRYGPNTEPFSIKKDLENYW